MRRGRIVADWCAGARERVERVALCNPNAYYKLAHMRRQRKDGRIALARLEEIAPFPYEAVARLAAAYPNAEITWVQEAPKNMGAWSWLQTDVGGGMRFNFPFSSSSYSSSPNSSIMVVHDE